MQLIESGDWQAQPGVADYFAGLVDDVLIERVIWGDGWDTLERTGRQLAGYGFIWYRFWVWRDDQLVERYYDRGGTLLGTQIDLCTPMEIEERQWRTHDLVLDIWIAPDGRVTVTNEAAFEAAVVQGELSREEADWAEAHVRRLTAAIAQGRFPPAMVRNWQVDIKRIEGVLERARQVRE
ncbi:MAG: DUF402 domain-containing protein [Anaerolineales bacterium]|nr:DUF402 domain-containing protein [Anaerolineales bacterium]